MYSHADALTTFSAFVDAIQRLIDQVKGQRSSAQVEGMNLYNLGEFMSSKDHLLIAATDGNKDAQYALAEVLRRGAGNVTEEAKGWYQKAADQNHFYALLRLADKTSLAKAKALADANTDTAQGQLQAYEVTGDIESLRKSEQAGNPEAKYILARLYSGDETLVPTGLTPITEQKRLLSEAAVAGLPKAMALCSRRMYENNKTTRRAWLEARLRLNDVYAVLDYGYALSTEYDMEEDLQEYGYPKDLVKAYAMLWLVVAATTHQFSRYNDTANNLGMLQAQLTEQEIAQAKQQAQEWKRDHPPLSEYRLPYQDL